MDNFVYNDIIKKISSAFESQLKYIEAIYNFEYGSEFEISICKFLRNFLPLKYGICRGFVVNKDGETAGDDIIIYDQEKYPTLRILGQHSNFERKEQIPVEAVYAYIEAKHTLNEETLKKAAKQIADVKKLCYSREPVYIRGVDANPNIFDNCVSEKIDWLPIIKNPVYGMILSANYKFKDEEKEPLVSIVKCINSMSKEIEEYGHFGFDSIAVGNSFTVFSGQRIADDGTLLITKFHTGIKNKAIYQVNEHKNITYGLVISHFMSALNLIELGDMPWTMIFNTAKISNKEHRKKVMDKIEGRDKHTDSQNK